MATQLELSIVIGQPQAEKRSRVRVGRSPLDVPAWRRQVDLFLGAPQFPRPRSVSARAQLSPQEKAFRPEALRILQEHQAERPTHRSECRGKARPCPFVSCSGHLYLSVEPNGALRLNFPGVDLEDMPATCWYDLEEAGERTFAEIARVMNLTEERVRQIYHESTKRPELRDQLAELFGKDAVKGRTLVKRRTSL